MPTIVPVILAGGSGTRLWPLSRRLLPKQFLPLAGARTLFQETFARLDGLAGCEAPVVVANHEHRFLAAEQLAAIGVRPKALLLEPVARSTAPAIAAAALLVAREAPDALLLVLPSDHLVDRSGFQADLARAYAPAQRGHLVTFGIRPAAPATGYGYIEAGEPLEGCEAAHRIRRFVEKPDLETAKRFVASGAFYWNSGMFVFAAHRFLDELRRHRPEILAAVERALAESATDLDFLRLAEAPFAAAPALSVDHAVMEKTGAGAVIRGTLRWSDVGSWSELWEIATKDAAQNAAFGDVELRDARGCYVRADSRLVSLLGVGNLVVVETDDAVLVAARERAQEVREVVASLDRRNRSEPVSHTRVWRPWGYYETVDEGTGYAVKRLMVKPGAALSLQRHARRAEHWVVVSGCARVVHGEESRTLAANESIYIPPGVVHRLENPGREPLYVIEVQTGDYLGEDDIERLEDRYGRG